MSRQVILQPAGDKNARTHYQDTIEKRVKISLIRSIIDTKTQTMIPSDIFNKEDIGVWGVTPGKKDANVGKWNKIKSGDIALFVRKGKLYSTSRVVAKFRNKTLAEKLWGRDSEDNTWEYIYLLDDIELIDIPVSKFNKAVGYKPNYPIYGFSVLDHEKSSNAIKVLNLKDFQTPTQETTSSKNSNKESPFGTPKKQKKVTIEDFQKVMEEWEGKSLDTEANTKARIEQGMLRDVLFQGKQDGICCMCGRLLPISFLVAAHIKKRSEATDQEKRDPNIVSPMCKLGCDELYERGYITVGSNGKIIATGNKHVTDTLNDFIEFVKGRTCSFWRTETQKYFEWHFTFFTK